MRAFVIKHLSHPSKIELTRNAPEPKQVPGHILVDVYSAGLNFFDVSTRRFGYPIPNSQRTYDRRRSFRRFCRLRGSTRSNRNSHLSWVQSSPVLFRKTRPPPWVVHSNRGIGCLDTRKERMQTKSSLTPGSFCTSQEPDF